MDYESYLTAVLRQDPDVVLVGELRTGEAAQHACEAALSGHLVLSTVHARDALGVLLRLNYLGVDLQLLAHSVRCVLYQSLVPILCENCKEIDQVEQRRMCDTRGELVDTLYRPRGCESCNMTGFHGRAPVNEVLFIDQAFSESILRCNNDMAALRRDLTDRQRFPLTHTALRLLQRGAITWSQMLEICEGR